MGKEQIPFRLCIVLAILHLLKGLEIAPSRMPTFQKFYETGTNLTFSCSETGLIHLDWNRDKSDLSSCSVNAQPYCLPGGRYTYENGSFNMMLINMKSGDCGRYICKTHTGSKSFDLHLIDHVKDIDVAETADSITMTTNCVYPAYTVNIQWLYIHQDGSPVVYHKPAIRSEERGNCVGTCWENKALKISSTLYFPPDVQNPIQIRMMVYIEQGGMIRKMVSYNLYTIEGCLPPRKDFIIGVICLTAILLIICIVHICLLKRHRRDNSVPDKAPVLADVTLGSIVNGVIFICCIILMVLKHETKIPDINGNCPDVTNMTHVVVIAFVIITISNYWIKMWEIWNLIRFRNVKRKYTGKENTAEMQPLSGTIEEDCSLASDKSKSDRATDPTFKNDGRVMQGNTKCRVETENVKRESEQKSANKDSHIPENLRLPCFPSTANEVLANIGEMGILKCILELKKYPSWQAPDGRIINYGGKKDIEKEFKGRITWDKDKKSIIVSPVKVCDAGTYVCFSSNGDVQCLTLVVILPTKIIEADEGMTAHLDPGNDITRNNPAWWRLTPLVPELYNTVQDDRIEIGGNKKSVFIKKCRIGDKGLYEVVGNNIIKRFHLSIKTKTKIDTSFTIHENSTLRLNCSSKNEYPSWECIEAGIFNYGGEMDFRSVESGNPIEQPNRFKWSDNKKSLLIERILMTDTGTYICRHANGSVESVTVIVRGKRESTSHKSDKDRKIRIPHDMGYKFPSLKYVQEDGKSEAISHQNYEPQTNKFKPSKNKGETVGYMIGHTDETANLVECSVYRQPIRVFNLKHIVKQSQLSSIRDNKSAVPESAEGTLIL